MNGIRAALLAIGASLAVWAYSRSSKGTTTSPTSPSPTSPTSPWRVFVSRILEIAAADVARPTVESGPNRSPEIDAMLAQVGQAPGQNWCAAWVIDVILRAAIGLVLDLSWLAKSASAKAVGSSFAGGRAVGAKLVLARDATPENVPPGSVAYWDRSDPSRPETSWWGHIGFVREWLDAGRFASLEGNSGADGRRCALMTRLKADPRLIGFGVWPT
jgi:hypothetical protein